MTSLVMLLVFVLVAILALWLVMLVLNAAKLGEPWRTIILVIVGLAALLIGLRYLGLW